MFTEIIVTPDKNPLAFGPVAGASFQAGTSALQLASYVSGGAALDDPEVSGGFTYLITRYNSTVQ